MSTAKKATIAVAAVAGLSAAGLALAPAASAGGPSTAAFNCSTSIGTNYNNVTGTFTTAAGKITVKVPIATGISFSSGLTSSISVNDSTSSSTVTYSGSTGTSNGTSVTVGPLPKTAGTASVGDTLNVITSGTPITMDYTPVGVTISCSAVSSTTNFSPTLLYS